MRDKKNLSFGHTHTRVFFLCENFILKFVLGWALELLTNRVPPGVDEAAHYLHFTLPERFNPLFELRQDDDGPYMHTRPELYEGAGYFVKDQRFPAQRDSGALRVAFLGGSSVQGWPWREDGVVFPELVGEELRERFPGFRPSRRGDWDKYPYVCMCYSDHGSRQCGPEVETEKTDCSCLEVASQGVCKRWYCREYDDAGRHDVEHEYYHATAIDGSTGRVHRWVGDVDSRGEFEMAECECTLPSDNGRFCVEWQCSERGLPYFYPNLFLSLAHLVLLVPPILQVASLFQCLSEPGGLSRGCKDNLGSPEACLGTGIFVFLPLAWITGSTIFCMWFGGVGELVIVLSVYLGLPSVCYGVYYVRAKRRGSAEGSTSSQPASPRQAGALVVQRARSGVAARASDARSWRQSRRRDDTAASAAASVCQKL